MTPDGEVLGEASNYASSARVLKAMLKVLDENGKYNKPSDAEKKAATPVATRTSTASDGAGRD